MTKNKILTILAAVAVLLVVILAAGLIAQSVKSPNKPNTDTANSLVAKVDECVLQESITFCGESTSAEPLALAAYNTDTASEEQVVSGNSTTLTLKLTSSVLSEVMLEKVNIPVTWGVEFVNADSSWASGKNVSDYVTVTPKNDFTRTVTLTNKAPFGEQIRLTATLDNDSSKTASCTVDYVKRFGSGFQDMFFANDFGDGIVAGGTVYTAEAVGTITGELSAYGTYIELESGFTSLLQSYLKFDLQFRDYSFSNEAKQSSYINYHSTYKFYSFDVSALDEQGEEKILDYSHFISNWDSLSEAQKTAVKFAWWKAYQEYGDNISIDLVFSYSYGEVKLGELSGYRTSYISGEGYGDGISVDGSLVNIVF